MLCVVIEWNPYALSIRTYVTTWACYLRKERAWPMFLPSSHALGYKVTTGQNIPFSHKRPHLGWAPDDYPAERRCWCIINHCSLENSFFPCFSFPLVLVYFFFLLSTISYFLWVPPSLVNSLAGSWGLGSLIEMWPIFSTGDERPGLFLRRIWNQSLSHRNGNILRPWIYL